MAACILLHACCTLLCQAISVAQNVRGLLCFLTCVMSIVAGINWMQLHLASFPGLHTQLLSLAVAALSIRASMSAYCTEHLRYLSEQVCQHTVLSICIICQSKYVSVLYWASALSIRASMSAYYTEHLRYLSEPVCQHTILSICIIYQSKYVSVLYWGSALSIRASMSAYCTEHLHYLSEQ